MVQENYRHSRQRMIGKELVKWKKSLIREALEGKSKHKERKAKKIRSQSRGNK